MDSRAKRLGDRADGVILLPDGATAREPRRFTADHRRTNAGANGHLDGHAMIGGPRQRKSAKAYQQDSVYPKGCYVYAVLCRWRAAPYWQGHQRSYVRSHGIHDISTTYNCGYAIL
jgi:hypothetical protein